MYMRLHGWRIVSRNCRTGRGTTAGEIDFIAVRGKTLAFVEVKKRRTLEEAAYAVSPAQQKRLIRGAGHFLQLYPDYRKFSARFDVVLVAPPLQIKHIPDAWRADE